MSNKTVGEAYEELVAFLVAGGPDGLYSKGPESDDQGNDSGDDQEDYPFQFAPPLPWRFTTSATHRTSGLGYADALRFSVGVGSDDSSSIVRLFSLSLINGALGDAGQNFKNLASIVRELEWGDPETQRTFGCAL